MSLPASSVQWVSKGKYGASTATSEPSTLTAKPITTHKMVELGQNPPVLLPHMAIRHPISLCVCFQTTWSYRLWEPRWGSIFTSPKHFLNSALSAFQLCEGAHKQSNSLRAWMPPWQSPWQLLKRCHAWAFRTNFLPLGLPWNKACICKWCRIVGEDDNLPMSICLKGDESFILWFVGQFTRKWAQC